MRQTEGFMPDELDLQPSGGYDFLFGDGDTLADDDGADVADIALEADGAVDASADTSLDLLAGEDVSPTGEPEPEPLDAREAAKLAILAAKGDLEAAAKLQEFDPDLAFDLDPAPSAATFTVQITPEQEAALQAYDEGLALTANGWDFQQWAQQNPLKHKAFADMAVFLQSEGLPPNATAAMIRDHVHRSQMAQATARAEAQLDPVATWRDLRADEASKALTAADWTAIRDAAKGKQGVQAVLAMHRTHERLVVQRERAAANAPAVAKVQAAAERAQRAQAAGQRPAPSGGAGTGSPAMTFEQLEDAFIEAGMNGRMTPQLAAQYERASRIRAGSSGSWSAV